MSTASAKVRIGMLSPRQSCTDFSPASRSRHTVSVWRQRLEERGLADTGWPEDDERGLVVGLGQAFIGGDDAERHQPWSMPARAASSAPIGTQGTCMPSQPVELAQGGEPVANGVELSLDAVQGEGDVVDRRLIDRPHDRHRAPGPERRHGDGLGKGLQRVMALAETGERARAGHGNRLPSRRHLGWRCGRALAPLLLLERLDVRRAGTRPGRRS